MNSLTALNFVQIKLKYIRLRKNLPSFLVWIIATHHKWLFWTSPFYGDVCSDSKLYRVGYEKVSYSKKFSLALQLIPWNPLWSFATTLFIVFICDFPTSHETFLQFSNNAFLKLQNLYCVARNRKEKCDSFPKISKCVIDKMIDVSVSANHSCFTDVKFIVLSFGMHCQKFGKMSHGTLRNRRYRQWKAITSQRIPWN